MITRKYLSAPLLLACAGLALAGCSSNEEAKNDTPASSSPSTSASSAAPVTKTPSKGSFGNEPQAPEGGGDSSASSSLSWDEDAQEQAEDTAVEIMRLYARPDVSAQAWRQEISVYLTDSAKDDYESFDPSYLDVAGVKDGSQKLDSEANAQRVTVDVTVTPGDQVFKIGLVHMPDSSWKADSIQPAHLGQH